MFKSLSRRSKVLIPIIFIAVVLLIVAGVFLLNRPVLSELDKAENVISDVGVSFTNQDFEKLNTLFSPNAVFVYKDEEIPYADGVEKLKAIIDDSFTCDTVMRTVTSSNDTYITCQADGKIVILGKKVWGQYSFELEKPEGSKNWVIVKMESSQNDWFIQAFGDGQ